MKFSLLHWLKNGSGSRSSCPVGWGVLVGAAFKPIDSVRRPLVHASVLVSIALLFVSPVFATDVTGLYGDAKPMKCDQDLFESGIGYVYVEACFRGKPFINGSRMSLVQNGSKVCGIYSECAGYNCNKLYGGAIVGTVKGGTLTLHKENGHVSEADPIEVVRYRIRGTTLWVVPDTPSKPTPVYRRVSSTLLKASIREQCKPNLSGKLAIRDFQFHLDGKLLAGIPDELISFHEPVQPLRKAPQERRIVVSSKEPSARYADERTDGNWVPRRVEIVNQGSGWVDVTAELPRDCREFLEYERERDTGSKGVKTGKEPLWPADISIAPGRRAWIRTCRGTSVSVEPRGK